MIYDSATNKFLSCLIEEEEEEEDIEMGGFFGDDDGYWAGHYKIRYRNAQIYKSSYDFTSWGLDHCNQMQTS